MLEEVLLVYLLLVVDIPCLCEGKVLYKEEIERSALGFVIGDCS